MSTLAIVLIVVGAVFLLLFLGGFAVTERRRRVREAEYHRRVADADHALEAARAEDRGWDRDMLHGAAREALAAQRPHLHPPERLDLVLVDDRPGTAEDRAHMVARGAGGAEVTLVLARHGDGGWMLEEMRD